MVSNSCLICNSCSSIAQPFKCAERDCGGSLLKLPLCPLPVDLKPTLWKLWLINFFISNLSLIDTFSVGYSTCHWCHVMEQESFQNEEIGRILNENFVCIKVDREERPDVDKVYMTFVQVRS